MKCSIIIPFQCFCRHSAGMIRLMSSWFVALIPLKSFIPLEFTRLLVSWRIRLECVDPVANIASKVWLHFWPIPRVDWIHNTHGWEQRQFIVAIAQRQRASSTHKLLLFSICYPDLAPNFAPFPAYGELPNALLETHAECIVSTAAFGNCLSRNSIDATKIVEAAAVKTTIDGTPHLHENTFEAIPQRRVIVLGGIQL